MLKYFLSKITLAANETMKLYYYFGTTAIKDTPTVPALTSGLNKFLAF